jgi:hypothetical protein
MPIRVGVNFNTILERLLREVEMEGGVCLSSETERLRKTLEDLFKRVKEDPSLVWKLEAFLLADEPADLSYRAFSLRSKVDLERELSSAQQQNDGRNEEAVLTEADDEDVLVGGELEPEPSPLIEAGLYAPPPIE